MGRKEDQTWWEVADPFVFEGEDALHYPAETTRVIEWIKERRAPSFTRREASLVARQCGLLDHQHKEYPYSYRLRRGTMYQALEILEVYDCVRSFLATPGSIHWFIVNPGLFADDSEPVELRSYRRAFTADQKRDLWFAAGGRCSICRIRLGPDWHADHVHPWSKNGLTVVENGQALCPECNRRKHAKVLTVDGGEG